MITANRHSRGFTLVELMVAITGGLFIAIVVFALARDGARFYHRESRVSDATMAGLVGFERLRGDISRAGFLATPNVRHDLRLCGSSLSGGWPAGLQELAGVLIQHGGSKSSTTLADNKLAPDSMVLAGSYSSNDQFPIWNVADAGTNYEVFLQWQTGPLARLGYGKSADQLAILTSLFGAGRALRIQDQSGDIQFATIQGVNADNNQPRILLKKSPPLIFRQTAGATCGLKGNVTGASVNVVNFVRYEIKSLSDNPNYKALYGGPNPYDADRTELVRIELDTDGNPIPGTEELVAEYAVDLKLGLTVATQIVNGSPTLATFSPDDANSKTTYAAVGNNPLEGPHRIRSVRVRLSVRSQEPDRDSQVIAGAELAPGLYRIGLGQGGTAPFARVRTLQADLALHNQMGVTW